MAQHWSRYKWGPFGICVNMSRTVIDVWSVNDRIRIPMVGCIGDGVGGDGSGGSCIGLGSAGCVGKEIRNSFEFIHENIGFPFQCFLSSIPSLYLIHLHFLHSLLFISTCVAD